MFSVNVSPDMAMYTLLINQGYDPTFALCEFIDNAIHAYSDAKNGITTPLRINLDFYSISYPDPKLKNSIVIKDSGFGITKEKLENALKPARRPYKTGLSEFGIGMKSASVWFAEQWKLETWPHEASTKFTAEFDLYSLLSQGKDTIDVIDNHDKTGSCGTWITLKSLRHTINENKYEEICTNISEIYQRFITPNSNSVEIIASFDGLPTTLKFTNTPSAALTSPEHVKIGNDTYSKGEAKEWKLNVDFKFQDHPVTGFIYLRDVGSYVNNPGLVLFRHNRVISGLTKKRYIPLSMYKTSNKHRAMRVYGELNLDEHPVSYTKDRFIFNDDDFIRALIESTKGLDKLLTQADNYRKSNVSPYSKFDVPDDTNLSTPSESTDAPPSEVSSEENVSGIQYSSSEPQPNESQSAVANESTNSNESEKLNTKPDTRIQISQDIVKKLNELKSTKHAQLYNSLCVISLIQHPALMYIAAWAFFESLARLAGNGPGTDFTSYFGSKIMNWGFDKGQKSSFLKSLKDISDEGNCTKHCGISVPVDAKQLANDFSVLEPLILRAIDEAIQQRKTQVT